MKSKILSKSSYLSGLQCPKLLWIKLNKKQIIPEIDNETRLMFEKGHKIGEKAKLLFPNGKDIPTEDFLKNLSLTRIKLNDKVPLFEASFLKDNLFSRADILKPNKDNTWDIYEVKSSKVKEINIHDASFQKYVYELYGLKIKNSYIIHKNKDLNDSKNTKKSNNINDYFNIVNITNEVENTLNGIKERIHSMQRLISSKNEPIIKMGKQCNYPYKCPLIPYCEKLKKNSLFGHIS